MQVQKAVKVRIYPRSQEDIILLEKHFGCNRFVYNYFLQLLNVNHKERTSFTYNNQARILTELKKNDETEWLKEVNSQSLQQTLKHLVEAKDRFYRKVSNFPTFKKKGRNKDSFKVPQCFKLDIENKTLQIPKFKNCWKWGGEWKDELIKVNSITISKSPTGKYYASIQGIFEIEKCPVSENVIGVDLGIKDLCIDSNGNVIENPKFLQKMLKKLKYAQRQHSRRKKGSKSREKWRKRVARLHERVRFQRENYLHQVSHTLVNENQVIAIENLAVKNMIKNKKLSKAISDVAWGTLVSQLKYKSEWHDRKLVVIDRFYPSSKSCSNCGHLLDELPLNIREWTCPSCGVHHDRDVNAAKNILNEGLNILSGSGTESDIKQKQQEASSIEESMNAETAELKISR
jgi:putative transposase